MSNQNPTKLDGNARNVAFARVIGSQELRELSMNSDGSIRIEIIPVSSDGTALATRHKLDGNSRWTSFGLDSADPTNQLPVTMTDLGGTAPAIRIDMSVI